MEMHLFYSVVPLYFLVSLLSTEASLESCRARFVNVPEPRSAVGFQSDGKYSQQDSSSSPSNIAASVNAFGFKLFRSLNGQANGAGSYKNVVVSPMSISLAFSILYNGATPDSETKSEIASTFGFESDECYSILLEDSIQKLVAGEADGNELSVASKVFVDDNVPVTSEFKNSADFSIVDFSDASTAAKKINEFVSKTTKGLIPNIVEAGSLDPATVMSIVNALFFKGEWATKFDASKSEQGEFTRADGTTKTVIYMAQDGEFQLSYTSEPPGLLLELPYRGGRYAMHLFLPTDTADIPIFLSQLSHEYWRDIVARSTTVDTKIRLPIFDIEAAVELDSALGRISPRLRRIFTSDAELSLISPETGVFVGSAVHRARVKINEEGTEAAAVTELEILPLSATPDFIADKPFTFFITDKENGNLIIFMGSVMDP